MSRIFIVPVMALLALSACGGEEKKPESTGTLTRTLTMTDKDGKRYGTVELDPVGGGKVMDIDGRTIGYIKQP